MTKVKKREQDDGVADGWISVEDRLPRNNCAVAVRYVASGSQSCVKIGKYDMVNGAWCFYSKGYTTATHWYPLPYYLERGERELRIFDAPTVECPFCGRKNKLDMADSYKCECGSVRTWDSGSIRWIGPKKTKPVVRPELSEWR